MSETPSLPPELEPCALEPCDLLPVEAVEVEAVAITAAELVPVHAEPLLLQRLIRCAVAGGDTLDREIAEWELAHAGQQVPADLIAEAASTAEQIDAFAERLWAVCATA